MTAPNQSESSARSLDVTTPAGGTADKQSQDNERLSGGTSDDNSHPAPAGSFDAAQTGAGQRGTVKGDAVAEFLRSDEGHEKGAGASESPRVTVGSGDIRFENDPGV